MKKRMFLGIPVPFEFQNLLFASLEPLIKLYPQWRWVKKENYHVTVSFIGTVEDKEIKTIIPAIEKIAGKTRSFSLRANSFHLAHNENPRMLWSGFEQSDTFSDLVVNIEKELAKKLILPNYRKDHHPLPHITLARFKSPTPDLVFPTFSSALPVTSLYLFESILSSHGPTYKKSEEFFFRE